MFRYVVSLLESLKISQDAVNCNISYTGLLKNVHWPLTHKLETDHSVSFEMIGDNITNTLQQLNSVRYRKTKFICINDQMENPSPELKQILKDFYLSFFPYPSQFELPSYRRNPTLYYDEYLKLYPRIDSRRFSHSISTRYTDIYLSTMSYLRQFLLENIWSLYEWLSGRVHPSTALIHWSKGEKLNKPKKGIELFIPYSSLFWGSIGLCCLIGLRLLIRNDRKRHLKSKKNTIFTGMIDSEKRRYYQTSGRKSTEEEVESMEGGDDDDDGEQIHYDHEEDEQFANAEIVETLNDDDKEEEEEEEDPLNKLWRTAGYGVSGKFIVRK